MADLKTDYKDQLLDTSVNTERKFNLVDSDGNVIANGVSLRDITQYSQAGDTFGAADINKITEKINEQNNSLTSIRKLTLLKSVKGTEAIDISSLNYSELIVIVEYNNRCFTWNVPKSLLNSTNKQFHSGYDTSASSGSKYEAYIVASNLTVKLGNFYDSATSKSSTTNIYVYYR